MTSRADLEAMLVRELGGQHRISGKVKGGVIVSMMRCSPTVHP